jgi:hypothetical protein
VGTSTIGIVGMMSGLLGVSAVGLAGMIIGLAGLGSTFALSFVIFACVRDLN